MKTVMNILAVILFSSILFQTAYAQVSGQVIGQQSGETIAYANVILAYAKDSSIIAGDFSDDNGNFSFSTDTEEALLVQVSMIGFADYYSPSFFYNKEGIEINCSLLVATHQLQTVEVVAKVPFLEQTAGKLTVNVAQNISGINGSMLDVLKKVPGVMVINKKVSLGGSSNISILIDGQPTDYLDIETLLSEMSADDIEKVEVISQANATLEASGSGGVINIILKKNKLKGTNGSWSAGVGLGNLIKYNTNLSLNHRTEKVNLNGSLGYSHNTSWESLDVNREIGTQTYEQASYSPSLPQTYKTRLGADWNVAENHTISLNVKAFLGDNDRTKSSHTDFRIGEELQENITSSSPNTKEWNYINTDLFYNWAIDNSGQSISFSSNYSRYTRNSTSIINITSTANDYPSIKNEEPGETNIQAYKLDYNLPLSKQFTVKSGLKFSQANTDNSLNAFMMEGADWLSNNSLTNHYIFDENIQSAYVQTAFSGDKINFQLGLRYELSNSKGYSATIDSTNTRKIAQLFPSASFDIPLNSTFGVSAAYSYRIKRPDYSTLNPFVSYFDPFSYQKGNPYLRPALTHSAKVSLTYNKQPFFNLEYKKTNDVLMSVTEQDDETGATYLTTTNMKNHKKYGASMFFPLFFIKGLDGYGGVMASYHIYDSPYLGDNYNKKKFSYVAFIQGSAKLPHGFKFEFGGWYNSGGLNGIMEFNNLFSTSFGIQKKLMSDQLTLKLSYDDAFSKYWNADINYANMNMNITSKWETKVLNFKATYKFGNRYLKAAKKRSSSAYEEAKRLDL